MDTTQIVPLRSRAAREAACEMPPELIDEMVLPTVKAAKFCGYSTDQWRDLVADHEAPPPIRFSARRLGWQVRDLKAWIQAKKKANQPNAT